MTQYIDKDALVAEINRVLNSYDPNEITSGRYALVDLRDFLDTLEVKGVNLEDEIERVRKTHFINDDFEKATLEGRQITNIAKHFFKLGLNASNPLTWEDVRDIMELYDDVTSMDYCNDIYEEVLKRFKAQKGENV